MLNSYEEEILKCVGGEPWPQWGSWVGACLSYLWENGYITSETNSRLTEKGEEYLEDLKGIS